VLLSGDADDDLIEVPFVTAARRSPTNAVLLLGIAVVLVVGHDATASGALLTGAAQMTAGVAAGFVIGIIAALLGVAGGELLIPTLVLLFGADIKLAGSLSLAVSLPTMLVGFARYSRDRSFVVLNENRRFVLVLATGSIFGSFHRRAAARAGAERRPTAVACHHPCAVRRQGLEAQVGQK